MNTVDSKYESTCCEDGLICPYCKYEHEEADLTSGESNEECCACGKIFHVLVEVVYQFSTTPNCVLNDTAHSHTQVTEGFNKCIECGLIDRPENLDNQLK